MLKTEEIFDINEFFSISRRLEQHHSVFYKLWEMGKPIFTEEIQTLTVSFNNEGEYWSFEINPKFWKSLSDKEKDFTVAHECLHVILNHGIRIKDMVQNETIKTIANIALDVAVNHILIDQIGFNRSELKIANELCFIDTVFPDKKDLESNKSFEYYFNLLKEDMQIINVSSLNDHSHLVSQSNEENDSKNRILKEISESLDDDEKQILSDIVKKEDIKRQEDGHKIQSGTGTVNVWEKIDIQKVQKKRKWESVIKKWSFRKIAKTIKAQEQWSVINRRFVFLDQQSSFMLPSELELEGNDKEKKKIQVCFFLDCSGSCYGLGKRFFQAAMSLPEDTFDIKAFTFDTKVHEIDLKKHRIQIGGGTSFSCINKYIEEHYHEWDNKEYPYVWILTDGYGNLIEPQYPEKWFWFLSRGNTVHYIPKMSKIYKLKDFE